MSNIKYPIPFEEKGLPACPHCLRPPHRLQLMTGAYYIQCARKDCPNIEDALCTEQCESVREVRTEWLKLIKRYNLKKYWNWQEPDEASDE